MSLLKVSPALGVLAAIAFSTASSPAVGQVDIGLMLSNISAERRERECQIRPVPNDSERIIATTAINGVMTRLRQPPAKDDAKAIGALFMKKDKVFKLASTEAYLSEAEFRALLGPAGSGDWRYLVIAADAESARGVWRVAPDPGSGDEAGGAVEIGIDLIKYRGAWKVLHAQAYPGEAPTVEPYCHLANTGSF
ncbi:MAG: hypothetical protein KF842_13245 [Caulobacter sp.]|nr:hypothetical protein [Caulobacter sp.]